MEIPEERTEPTEALYVKRNETAAGTGEYVALVTLPDGLTLKEVMEIGVVFRRMFHANCFGTLLDL